MTKNNYLAWTVQANDFSDKWTDYEKLLFFARYAILAPSGHNTQPWKFTKKDQSLMLEHNTDVQLAHSGKLAAEPYVSLGSCLETLVLAGQAFGYELHTAIDNAATSITVSVGKKIAPQPALASAIVNRASNRKYYDETAVDKKLIALITQRTFSNCIAQFTEDRKEIEFLADQTKIATQKIMSDAAFRKELSYWVRNNLTKKYTGMPGFAQEMPTPPSLVARHVITYFDVSKTQAKTDASRVIHSPGIVLIMATTKQPESYLNAGRMYARTCILAQQYGYATSGVGAAAIDLDSKQLVKKQLGLAHEPTAMIRIGKTNQKVRHTPRQNLEQVLS